MKVILLTDFAKIGKKDDIVTVADSYAKNVLIPQNICVPATKSNINNLTEKKEKEAWVHKNNVSNANHIKFQLENIDSIIMQPNPSNQEGKMFGSITNKDISEKLKTFDIDVDKKDIIFQDQIKGPGVYPVKIKLYNGICAELSIIVAK